MAYDQTSPVHDADADADEAHLQVPLLRRLIPRHDSIAGMIFGWSCSDDLLIVMLHCKLSVPLLSLTIAATAVSTGG